MSRRLFASLMVLGLAVLTAGAAGVDGQWTAQVTGRGGQTQELTFSFKAAGEKLTGTITSPRGESPISDGKIAEDQISFTQTLEFGGNTIKFLYKGKVSGDEIKFTREREGGEGKPMEFVAKRKST